MSCGRLQQGQFTSNVDYVTLLTNQQQIRVLTRAQPTRNLTPSFPDSADHSPGWIVVQFRGVGAPETDLEYSNKQTNKL